MGFLKIARITTSGALPAAGLVFAIGLLAVGCNEGRRAGSVSEDALVAGGRASFQAYCASCHGRDGKGNGPVAANLTVHPADLTGLSARNNGQFPRDYVMQTIDGRAQVQAHGSRTMPVWGKIWRSDPKDPSTEQETERLINELVHYIQSIQEKPDAQ
jgi:mono/diheme cytochrome c family protein